MSVSQSKCERHEPEASLSRTGDYSIARFAGRVSYVRHTKGIADLSLLLAQPGQELHVLELLEESKSRIVSAFAIAGASQERLNVGRRGTWDEPLDARARAAYRARYVDLVAALDEAQSRNDAGHMQRLSEELGQLVEQLQQRTRVACNATERARKAVYNRLHAAIARIATHDGDFGRHLAITIKTGISCSYRPEFARWVSAC
jgi:hypothetical protein